MSPDDKNDDIANDVTKVNNFTFNQSDVWQSRCPFAAHMRKSNPRNDLPESERYKHLYVSSFCPLALFLNLLPRSIRRHNMPYGPEIDDNERRTNKTIHQRGLHLCSYQSSIERGFRHIQIGTKGLSCSNVDLVTNTYIF